MVQIEATFRRAINAAGRTRGRFRRPWRDWTVSRLGTRRGVVGHGRAQVTDGRLVVTGTISASGQAAREIVDAAKNGFPWQASVGVEVLQRRRVAAGETVAVNGKAIKAPTGGFMLVSKGAFGVCA